jgi:hypothetical protein
MKEARGRYGEYRKADTKLKMVYTTVYTVRFLHSSGVALEAIAETIQHT